MNKDRRPPSCPNYAKYPKLPIGTARILIGQFTSAKLTMETAQKTHAGRRWLLVVAGAVIASAAVFAFLPRASSNPAVRAAPSTSMRAAVLAKVPATSQPAEKWLETVFGMAMETGKDFFADPNFSFDETGQKWKDAMSDSAAPAERGLFTPKERSPEGDFLAQIESADCSSKDSIVSLAVNLGCVLYVNIFLLPRDVRCRAERR